MHSPLLRQEGPQGQYETLTSAVLPCLLGIQPHMFTAMQLRHRMRQDPLLWQAASGQHETCHPVVLHCFAGNLLQPCTAMQWVCAKQSLLQVICARAAQLALPVDLLQGALHRSGLPEAELYCLCTLLSVLTKAQAPQATCARNFRP